MLMIYGSLINLKNNCDVFLKIDKIVGIVYTNLATIDEDGKWLEISRHSKDRYSGNITKKLLIDNFVTGIEPR